MKGDYSSNEPPGANKMTAKTNVGGWGYSLCGSALCMPEKCVGVTVGTSVSLRQGIKKKKKSGS